MARQESDREDLLREATALRERAEWVWRGMNVVAGFRSGGELSVFFGVDPVYQFNADGELRRGYAGGRLLKAAEGKLASLVRQRTAEETTLERHDLAEGETAAVLSEMNRLLADLRDDLLAGRFELVGETPPDSLMAPRLAAWLAERLPIAAIARLPNVRT